MAKLHVQEFLNEHLKDTSSRQVKRFWSDTDRLILGPAGKQVCKELVERLPTFAKSWNKTQTRQVVRELFDTFTYRAADDLTDDIAISDEINPDDLFTGYFYAIFVEAQRRAEVSGKYMGALHGMAETIVGSKLVKRQRVKR